MKMAKSTPSDDTIREILLRVSDMATLFRCGVTCKRWRRLIAKPSFLLRRRPWPPSLGFFSQRLGTSSTDSSSELAFSLLHGPSVLGTHPRSLSFFVRPDDVAATDIVPLASHGGLFLLRLYPCNDDDLEPTVVRLAVYDLLAGNSHVLPELDCNTQLRSSNPYSYAILPSGEQARTFWVLMIGADKDKAQFSLHALASGEPTWRAPTKCFDMTERQIWSVEQEEAVVCRGTVHWLFVSMSNHFHVLTFNPKTGHVSLTKLLSPTKEVHFRPTTFDRHGRAQRPFSVNRLITTAGGAHLSLCVYSGRELEIWTQEQDGGDMNGSNDDAVWLLTRVIDHRRLTERHVQTPSIWSGERSSTLLITDYDRERKFIAHLDAGTLQEVTSKFRDHAWSTIMLVEIDWQTFFARRLGGGLGSRR